MLVYHTKILKDILRFHLYFVLSASTIFLFLDILLFMVFALRGCYVTWFVIFIEV
jgi:hypothetical protein